MKVCHCQKWSFKVGLYIWRRADAAVSPSKHWPKHAEQGLPVARFHFLSFNLTHIDRGRQKAKAARSLVSVVVGVYLPFPHTVDAQGCGRARTVAAFPKLCPARLVRASLQQSVRGAELPASQVCARPPVAFFALTSPQKTHKVGLLISVFPVHVVVSVYSPPLLISDSFNSLFSMGGRRGRPRQLLCSFLLFSFISNQMLT